jgi:hypothetical protein
MTDLTESIMVEPAEEAGSNARRIMWMTVSGLGIVMTAGAVAGYLAEHQAQGGGPLGATGIIVMAVFAAIICGLAYAILRNSVKIRSSNEPLLRREKMNQRVVVGSGLLGGLIAVVLMMSATASGEAPSIFASVPIEPWVAVLLAAIVGIGMPILSWYWHARVIDEQEADAYRSGALIAIYAFWIVAPVWWLLWRGGMLPAPDGVALYLMTTFVALIIWFWKKYR